MYYLEHVGVRLGLMKWLRNGFIFEHVLQRFFLSSFCMDDEAKKHPFHPAFDEQSIIIISMG
jgi:hypothetical protein